MLLHPPWTRRASAQSTEQIESSLRAINLMLQDHSWEMLYDDAFDAFDDLLDNPEERSPEADDLLNDAEERNPEAHDLLECLEDDRVIQEGV